MGYEPLRLEWDDAIVTNIKPLCGPLTHVVHDDVTLPILASTVFDKATKSLAVQTD